MSDKKANPLKHTLLVVEDEVDLREVLVELLQPHDLTVLSAGNGVEALDILSKRDDVDAIISDFKMPVMDGVTFLYQVRARGFATPFVLLTGCADKDNAINALRLGAFDFFEKPFEPQELIRRLLIAVELGYRSRQFQLKIAQLSLAGTISPEMIESLERAKKAIYPSQKT